MQTQFFKWCVLMMVVLALVACGGPSKPTVTLTSMSSSTPVENQQVTLQVSASDAKGVARIELTEGSDVLAEANATPPQKSVVVPLTWRAVQGQHTLTVRAINTDNLSSDPVTVAMNVAPAPQPTAMPGPLPAPTAPPQPTKPGAPTAVPQPGPCTNNSQFVADVTVPDGTPWVPHQTFNKVWRVRNTGTCTWSNAYTLTFVSGEAMTGATAVGMNKVVAPNDTVDILVTMTAPAAGGPHTGQWQMRDDKGALFGVLLRVSIQTILPQPTACMPNIQYFTGDPGAINRGGSATLAWGLVTNANRVEIDNGIGGIGTPGYRVVNPQQTTTYTLTAWCGSTIKQSKVTIYVNQLAPTPVPPTAVPTIQPPQRRNISGTWRSGNFSFELAEALGCGGPQCGVSGRLVEAKGVTTPTIEEVSGSFNVYSGVASLAVARPGASGINCTVAANSASMTCSGPFGTLTFTK